MNEDCGICNDTVEIEELRNMTRSIHERLSDIMMSENITTPTPERRWKRSPSLISLDSEKFEVIATNLTHEALKTTEKIPENVTAKVDTISTIYVESLSNLPTTIAQVTTSLTRTSRTTTTFGKNIKTKDKS